MRPALRSLGMAEMRFHDLRHTYASMLLDAGYEPRKVSHWMGHANLNTTDTIYGHLYPSDYESDSDRLDAYARHSGVIEHITQTICYNCSYDEKQRDIA
jgi:integrase